MTNPFTDDAIDDALKACDVLTDAWDRLVRHKVFDHCRDQAGMPDKMLARLDHLAKAETERDRIAATLRRTKKERDEALAVIERAREAAEGLSRPEFRQMIIDGHTVEYTEGWDAACVHVSRALNGGEQ